MRVLLTTVNSSLLDGINRHILSIACALNGYRGIEILVCTTHPRGELHAELSKRGVRCVSLDSPHGHSVKVLWRFWRIIQEVHPDIIHVHVLPIFGLMLMPLLTKHIRCIETRHGIPPRFHSLNFKGKISYGLERLFKIRGKVNCYISSGVKDFCLGMGDKEPYYTIYNPIAFEDGTERRHRQYKLHKIAGVPSSCRIMGTACRLAKIKNLRAMAEVMCGVIVVKPDIHAVVIGDGDGNCVDDIKSVFAERGLSTNLHLIGYQPNAAELVRDMSCFLMTSYEEGMPTAVLEAMSEGVPLAMFEGGGGLVDLLNMNKKCQFAITAKLGDVAVLSRALTSLMSNSEEMSRLSNNARVVAKKHFSLNKIRDEIANMYMEVSNHK